MKVTLTEKAVSEVKRIAADSGMSLETNYLRIAIKGGGCSGFSWSLNLDDTYNEGKDELEKHGDIQVVIDNRSAMYIEGTNVDFYDDGLLKRGFLCTNPSVKSTCGCGSSFSM